METQRLERLSEILLVVEEHNLDQFNMDLWYRRTYEQKEGCGFSACAGGWAAIDPELRQQGLYLDENHHICYTESKGTGFTALSYFFGISDNESSFLFDPDAYSYEHLENLEEDGYVEELAYYKSLPEDLFAGDRFEDTEIKPHHVISHIRWLLEKTP